MYILSKGELVAAFQKPNDTLRVVSVLPNIDQKSFEKKVETELKGDSQGGPRLNNLGTQRQLVQKK